MAQHNSGYTLLYSTQNFSFPWGIWPSYGSNMVHDWVSFKQFSSFYTAHSCDRHTDRHTKPCHINFKTCVGKGHVNVWHAMLPRHNFDSLEVSTWLNHSPLVGIACWPFTKCNYSAHVGCMNLWCVYSGTIHFACHAYLIQWMHRPYQLDAAMITCWKTLSNCLTCCLSWKRCSLSRIKIK